MKEYIKHKGIIVAQNSPTQYAVKIEQLSACASCHVASLCSAAESKEKIIEAISNKSLPIGTTVTVYGKKTLGYKALAWAVIIPLFIVLITLPTATHFSQNELLGGMIALLVLVPYYTLLALMRKRIERVFIFYIKH